MQIMAKRDIPKGSPAGFGAILLCKTCRGLMSLDLGTFYAEVDIASVNGSAFDTVLYHFLTMFIRDVWAGPKAPTWTQLCVILNASGIKTQKGLHWEFHNIRQKCDRLSIDPPAIFGERAPAVPTEAAEWLEQSINNVASHPSLGPEYVRGWGEIPDMPGMPDEDGVDHAKI